MMGLNRRQMERMMRQMGMRSKELEGVEEVVIKLNDREIVIPGAQVVMVEFAGQKTYQITGSEIERKREFQPSDDDVRLVMEQAGVDRERAIQALKETNGDLAEAILKLKSE